jgi:hypothetical protein
MLYILGCVTMESIVNNEQHPFVEINGDPGHCFPGCSDHTIVGVTKTKVNFDTINVTVKQFHMSVHVYIFYNFSIYSYLNGCG